MHNSYKVSIIYFVFFSILLLVSAFMIFATKIGFSPADISSYYLGNEEKFMQAKSFSGLLKVIYPHIFAMALFTMVLLHFVYFTNYKKSKIFQYLIISTYLTILLEIFSPFAILQGATLFAIIKLISMLCMFILFFFIFWLLLKSILIQKNQNF